MAGFTEGDPLEEAAKSYAHITYRSSFYVFSLENEGLKPMALDRRPGYVEIAAL
jgi:hypothetical protein